MQSPLPVGDGVTLLISKDAQAVTVGLGSQTTWPLNVWQVGLTGTLNDRGEGLIYSTSETAAPGLKAKVGIGYSSFLELTPKLDALEGEFIAHAWCLDTLRALSEKLSPPVPMPAGVTCSSYHVTLTTAVSKRPPAAGNIKKEVDAVLQIIEPIAAAPSIAGRMEACSRFKTDAPGLLPLCPGFGPIASVEIQRTKYPTLYDQIVAGEERRTFYYKAFVNYQPVLTSVPYRLVTDTEIDLATRRQWTRWLSGVTADWSFFYGPFSAGAQIGYTQTAGVALARVCRRTTSGDFAADQCRDAMLGEPQIANALVLGGAVAMNPFVLPAIDAFLQPGGQLDVRYERLSDIDGYSLELSAPLYVAPAKAPLGIVVGFRPTWTRQTIFGPTTSEFSLFLFFSARPRAGG